jgi:hypothetical protein
VILDVDPITAFFNRDWASVGGWSLLIGFVVVWIGIGSFKEWWVPGPRARRTENALLEANKLVQQLTDQNGKLIEGNELTQYVIGQVMPKSRGKASTVVGDKGESP